MSLISNLSMLFITVGITANNLSLASIVGNGLSFRENRKWVLILILVFIIQNQVLYFGEWLGARTEIFSDRIEGWVALAGIILITIKMILELKIKNNESKYLLLDVQNFLRLVFGTFFSVFMLGLCMDYLNQSGKKINHTVLPLLLLYMFAGMVLGKYRWHKILNLLNVLFVLLVVTGVLLFIFSEKNN